MPRSKFAVLTDSACDMPYALEQASNLEILRFHITVDGRSYVERDDFTFEEYFDILRTCTGIPSTAHITMPVFLAKFEAYNAQGVENLLYVSICGKGSATLDAATMARREFLKENPTSSMNIVLVDSHTYSMNYGYYVAEAARKLTNGADFNSTVSWLEDKFTRADIVLGAYSLRFMKKSGRISAAAAFAGELLGLRPIISLTDGVSTVRKKVRGDKEVIPSLVSYVQAHISEDMFYMVGGTDDARIEEAVALCTKKLKVKPAGTFKLGAAVATNTGPDAIAITFEGEKRR